MQKASLSDNAYRAIRYKIVSSELSQGTIVTENLISELTGVSRTPAREALDRLFREGWLDKANGKSFCVNTVRSQHVEDIFQLRRMMEMFAIEIIFKNGDSRLLAGKMDKALDGMLRNRSTLIDFISQDFLFHTTTFETVGNAKMLSMWKTLGEEMIRMGVLNMQGGENRMQEVVDEHNAIIDALWFKDLNHAKKAVLYHLERSRAEIITEQ